MPRALKCPSVLRFRSAKAESAPSWRGSGCRWGLGACGPPGASQTGCFPENALMMYFNICEESSAEYKPRPCSFPAVFMACIFQSLHNTEKPPLFIYLVLIQTMYVAADTKQGRFLSPEISPSKSCALRLIIHLLVFVSEGRGVSEWEPCFGSWANAI